MRLFSDEKVPVFLKAWSGATEKAPRHGETKVVKVTFAVPLTAERASSIVPGDGEIKFAVYKASGDGSLRPFLRSSTFEVSVPKQKLTVFATPDSPTASICFDHVKVSKHLTTKSGVGAAHLVVKATVGPCGPAEYSALGMWHEGERFVTFDESEPELEFDDEDDVTDTDEKARKPLVARPTPEWDDEPRFQGAAQQAAPTRKPTAASEKTDRQRYPRRHGSTTQAKRARNKAQRSAKRR